LSSFTKRLLWDYVWTRFPAWLIVALPLLVIAPVAFTGGIVSFTAATVDCFLALLLSAEFRLWDDLCDREQDCREDPQRVLCRTESLTPFIALVFALAIAAAALVAWLRSWQAAGALLLLHAVLGLWYAVRAKLELGPVMNFHIVLLKYPAFGFLLGMSQRGELTPALLAWLAVVYLGLCIFEVLHDPRLRCIRAAWIWLTVDVALLLGISVGLGLGKFS